MTKEIWKCLLFNKFIQFYFIIKMNLCEVLHRMACVWKIGIKLNITFINFLNNIIDKYLDTLETINTNNTQMIRFKLNPVRYLPNLFDVFPCNALFVLSLKLSRNVFPSALRFFSILKIVSCLSYMFNSFLRPQI